MHLYTSTPLQFRENIGLATQDSNTAYQQIKYDILL